MERSFKDYISNPLGAKNTVFSSREMYKNLYTNKFNLIMLRENGKIDYKLYKDKNNYYIHLKIPSEQIKEFYYDIVIQFVPQKSSELEMSLDNYVAKYYSNDPSFVFTFAHAFIENNMFITDLKPKMSKLAVKKVAQEKNPDNQIGYVKTLYFAYLFMKSRGLFRKVHYTAAEKYDKKVLLSNIIDADEKIQLRTEKAKELNKYKRKEIRKYNKPSSIDNGEDSWNNKTSFVKKVGTVNKTGSNIKSKLTKRTKTTKKI